MPVRACSRICAGEGEGRAFAAILTVAVVLAALLAPPAHAVSRVKLSADSVTQGANAAKALTASFDVDSGALALVASGGQAGKTSLGAIALGCERLVVDEAITCDSLTVKARGEVLKGSAGLAKAGVAIALSVVPPGQPSAEPATGATQASGAGEPQKAQAEAIEVTLQPDGNGTARATQLLLSRVNEWLPKDQPTLRGGTLDAQATFSLPTSATPLNVAVEASVSGAAFADAAGLRAGEKLAAKLSVRGTQKQAGWAFTGDLQQTAGEVFWQPVYLAAANNRLRFDVELAGDNYIARRLQLSMGGMGAMELQGRGSLTAASLAQGIREAKLTTGDIDLTRVYLDLVKPIAAGTLLSELDVTGRAKLELDVLDGKASRVRVTLTGANVSDPQGRIGLTDLSLDLPWVRGEATGATLRWQAARFYKVPLGGATLPIALSPESIEMRYVRIPILDGALELDRFAGDRADGSWPIVLSGRITPIAMPALSRVLGWPEMAGTLAAELPGMIYHQRALTINGEFAMRVFDGDIVARGVHVEEALGKSPRMTGELAARRLDLGLITQTFKFGRMEGRIDADLADMELVNWRPNQLNARIASSPGDYRKKISQQAVQNISSLGGAGAAAAIQRSVLRFFEEFGYDKLGLTCKLTASVCEMGGVESAPQGYVLVKGGGVPAISVLGYNRRVSWQELVRRVTAAVESNEKPIIK
jgi:hypothetical protein